MKNTLLVSFWVSILSLVVNAQAVYVDVNLGDDKNPGSIEAPLFSIHKAMEIVKSKDNSTYSIKITFKLNRMVFRNFLRIIIIKIRYQVLYES